MARPPSILVYAAVLMASSAIAGAQGMPAKPATPPAAPGAPASAPPVTTPGATGAPVVAAEPYTYDPEGRRDPFVSLLSRGVEPVPGDKTSGLGGVTTSELIVRGVIQSRGAYIALVAGPDGKTYRAHVNDRLLDGVIRNVTPQGVVIMQEVNDPLSLVKQREVRKGLRTAEDGK